MTPFEGTPRGRSATGGVRACSVVAARVVLAAIAGLMLAGLLPPLTGGRSTLVLSGSMSPALEPGDLVISRPAPSIRAGQVVVFVDPSRPGRTLTHRVQWVGPGGDLTTKGDANPTADSGPVPRAAVVGVMSARVPAIGRPVLWVRQGDVVPLIGSLLVLVVLNAAAQGAPRKKRRRIEPSENCS